MAYQFGSDRAIGKQVPRIARKQASSAIAALDSGGDPHEQVHEARTSVKKLRALLRLCRASLGGTYTREDRKLRDLADTLAELRDAEVLIKTFDRLWGEFDEQLGPPLRRVRTRLTTRLRSVEHRIDLPATLREARRAFKRVRKRARRWTLACGRRDGGWGAIVGGLEGTYQRARRAQRAAYGKGKAVAFHDWRKAVKAHGYHVRLLHDVWPVGLDARQKQVDDLGELLGLEHDLTVFADTLIAEPRCFDNPHDRDVMLGLIERRREALRTQARPIGARLFAENPRAFTARMHRYWRIWRRNPAAPAAPAVAPQPAAAAPPAAAASPPPPSRPQPRHRRGLVTELLTHVLQG